MEKYVINFILLLILLSGCNDKPPCYSEKLLHLESRVNAVPDSVYCQLDSFNTEIMSEADRALFINIRTESADKLYKEHTTDSLIAEARDFFKKANDIPRLARAWYLTGRIHTNWEKWTLAAEDFLKARELAKYSNDLILRGRIASFLGDVYWENRLYPESRTYFREAYSSFEQARDTVRMAYTVRKIGETYMANYQTDSAILIYKQALTLAKITGKRSIMVDIHHRLGYMYQKIGNNELALTHMRLGIMCSDSKPYAIFNNLGKLYIQMNKLDSAHFYLEQVLKEASSLPTLCLANSHLGELAKKEGKPEEAYAYLKKYEMLADSLDHSKQTKNIIHLQHKQKEKELTEAHESQLRMKDYVIIGLAIFVIISAVLAYRLRYKKRYYQKEVKKLIESIRKNEAVIRQLKEQNEKNPEGNLSELLSKEQIEQENLDLLKKFHRLNMEQCHRNPFLKKLYEGKKDIIPAFEQKEWKRYDEAFFSIYPLFTDCLRKSFPKLSEQEVRICQLSIMGVKTSKVADVFLLQPDTISSYKQKIKKSCFPNETKTLEELLLRFIVG